MTERFNRAIKALVKAYLNDTLQAGNCYACAVGNIVAECIGNTFKNKNMEGSMLVPDTFHNFNEEDLLSDYWTNIFMTSHGKQSFFERDISFDEKLLKDTGYTHIELAKVEWAFENNTKYKLGDSSTPEQLDQDRFNGLMAVVDVLCELEGITEVQQYKEMFIKA